MKQTDSKYKSVRGWGCYLCALAWIAGVRDIRDVDRFFIDLISSGWVLDNQLPTTKRGWYRCFVVKPERVVEYYARMMGSHVHAQELTRHPHDPRPTFALDGLWIVMEAATENGSHFGVVYPDVYNPDPRFPLDDGRTWRAWSVANVE